MSDSTTPYAKRVREECFKAILRAASADGTLRLSEQEIYEGVVTAIAMIHASQDDPPSAEKTAIVSNLIARHFRERVEELKTAKAQNGYFSHRRTH